MDQNKYKSKKSQIYDYYKTTSLTFDDSKKDKYNPKGIGEDKNYLLSDAVVVLNFKVENKTGAVTYGVGDFHIGSPESRYKNARNKIDFAIDATSRNPEYEFNIVVLQDLLNAGNVRLDRDAYHQTFNVETAREEAKYIVDALVDYIRGNVQANHEDFIDDLIGSNPTLWYDISKKLYSRGVIVINFDYENLTERVMVVHKFNNSAIELAKMLGVDTLYAAHTHKPRVLMEKYEYFNELLQVLESKTLKTMVSQSAVPTSKYGVEESMRPVSDVGFMHEQYESKDKINSNFINEHGLFARFNSLKPRQIKRVDDFKIHTNKFVESEIKRASELPLAEAIIQMKMLKSSLYSNLSDLIEQYEIELLKEAKVKNTRVKNALEGKKKVNKSQKQSEQIEESSDELIKTKQGRGI